MSVPIRFISTRGGAPPVGFSAALLRGLAPDGGLYVPERWPTKVAPPDADGTEPALHAVARAALSPFFAGDPLAPALGAICEAALDFPVPLVELGRDTTLLELFHGPTAAFKDVGARFLAECLARVESSPAGRVVLVATSGDTGAAVAGAFFDRPGFEVMILYPRGMVSARQERQLTAWGGNVRAFAVRGTFDDCQRVVKAAFTAGHGPGGRALVSANSINVGRLLPQVAYHGAAALAYARRHGAWPGLIVPSGNVGNATAALWARRLGFPIREVVLATNANRPVVDFLAGGPWLPAPARATLANAMDVGDPSNIERLRALVPDDAALRREVSARAVSDDEIRATIADGPRRWGRVFCPHTATAVFVREREVRPHWIVVATAHPAKFEAIVEPLVGVEVPPPPALAALLARPGAAEAIAPSLEALTAAW